MIVSFKLSNNWGLDAIFLTKKKRSKNLSAVLFQVKSGQSIDIDKVKNDIIEINEQINCSTFDIESFVLATYNYSGNSELLQTKLEDKNIYFEVLVKSFKDEDKYLQQKSIIMIHDFYEQKS